MNHKIEKITQRVVRQFIEALLFEGIIEYRYSQGSFHFNIGALQFSATGSKGAFGRVRLETGHILFLDAGAWVQPEALLIVEQLPVSKAIKKQLKEELQQTINLSHWNQENIKQAPSRRDLTYRQLEAAIHEGHPYHPCFKARTSFNIEDHMHYGPEYANTFKLHWLAVRSHFIQICFNKPLDSQKEHTQNAHHQFWLTELGNETWSELRKRLIKSGGDWQNYRLMPVHPWQIKQLSQQLEEALESKDIIDLGEAGDQYQASISVRTLINVSRPKSANIKLPMNMVNSSSLRTLDAHSITSAPSLSLWLSKLIDEDFYFNNIAPLSILPEYAGIRLQEEARQDTSKEESSWPKKLEGQLGVIFRESVEKKHFAGGTLPFVALAVIENDTLPFIHPWINHYGCAAWVQRLIKVAVIPVWHLLVHHGIALEAHAQNLILLHQQGWPEKIIMRDFHESLEFVYSYLDKPELSPNFQQLDQCYLKAKPNQYYWMDNLEALRELIVDTLFVFNLSELSTLLEKHYGYQENLFWQQVSSELRLYENRGFTGSQRLKQVNIREPRIQTESLLKKKLSGKAAEEFHHQTSNALAKQYLEEHTLSEAHQKEMNTLC